jgi:hypothetical protein
LVLLSLIGQFALIPIAMAAPGVAVIGISLFALGAFVYQIAVSLGIWRSARQYSGPKVWAVLARIAVVFSFASLAMSIVIAVQLFLQDSHDSSRSSTNVAATLSRNPAYPLTGFWKSDCHENFGLAIEPVAQPKTYSVSFCGPGGCFKPGTYRPSTTIAGDPDYRVVDENTIEVKGRDGFLRYFRCE